MNKGIVIGAVIVVLVAVLAGGFFMMSRNSSSTTETPFATNDRMAAPTTVVTSTAPDAMTEEATPAPGTVKEFVVEGSGFKFSPTTMKVKKGDTVRILFKNTEGFHDLVIDEFEVATNQISAGEEEEVEFVADKVGSFEYYCSVGNHRKMGMTGMLIVE